MWVWGWLERGGVGGGIWSAGGGGGRWNVGVAVGVTAMAGIALAAVLVVSSHRGSLKSPWSRRKRKHALSPEQWNNQFTPDGRLCDGGVKFLKKVRSGGIDPSIRHKVWPFLLGVFDLNSSEEERIFTRAQKRNEYEKLRRQCWQHIRVCGGESMKAKEQDEVRESTNLSEVAKSPGDKEMFSARQSPSTKMKNPGDGYRVASDIQKTPTSNPSNTNEDDADSGVTHIDTSTVETESSGTDSSVEESEAMPVASTTEGNKESNPEYVKAVSKGDTLKASRSAEDFCTWQRIIRLDAIRANAEWIDYSPSQAAISEVKALRSATGVGLKDFEHLEPCRIYHAARLVAILEAYALYDPEIGYCQGMSDLLSPILAVMEDNAEAFWCFVGFMKKARHNFRLDEVGIRKQLSTVSKIIKCKDSHLFSHLEKLQAEDCFFVYRMVVVMFRRELNFEQTVCLWEVMWADQAAIRAGIGKSAWGRTRLKAPPTEDLLLYAIAASVLQRRKLIIESYSSMDEIIRECNSMAGQLDVWKLLDDAHNLVVTLHDQI